MFLVLLLLLVFQDEPAGLIENLRSEKPEVRDAATQKLKVLGEAARPALEKAAKDPDGEVASRASYLLRILQLKNALTPNLQKAIPSAADRLALGEGSEWAAVFLEATALTDKGERKLQAITRDDLMPLAAPAIRGAAGRVERLRVCWMAANWRLKSALPEIRKLFEGPNREGGEEELTWYVVLGGREAAEPVAALLKDDTLSLRRRAAHQLAYMGTRAQIPALKAALKDPDVTVQMNAATALGALGDRSHAAEIIPLLDGKDRASAVLCLGFLGAKEHAPRIASLLTDTDARWYALAALYSLDARDHADEVAKLLASDRADLYGHAATILGYWKSKAHAEPIAERVAKEDNGTYSGAISGLGRMGDARSSGALVLRLKDDSTYVRGDVAEALAALDARDCTDRVALLLEDPEPHVRRKAAQALGRMSAKGCQKRLQGLETDPSNQVRFAASIALIRLGVKNRDEQRDIAQRLGSAWFEYWMDSAADCCLALTEIHERPGFEKLMREAALKRSIDTLEDLEKALGDSGLRWINREDQLMTGRMGTGRVIRPLDLVKTLIQPLPWIILEKDELRIVSRESALLYWIQRLDAK
jgi:HEAT repeat protein